MFLSLANYASNFLHLLLWKYTFRPFKVFLMKVANNFAEEEDKA